MNTEQTTKFGDRLAWACTLSIIIFLLALAFS